MKFIALAVAVLLVGLDQLVKYIVDANMQLHDSIPVIVFGDVQVFNITYERNTGAAFSMLEGKMSFLIIFTLLVIVGLLWYLFSGKAKNSFAIWCISLIIAGGAGNLIDRIFRGFVVDFFDFKLIGFAVFNIADICAVAGSIGLLIYVIITEFKASKEKKPEDNQAQTED